MRNQHHISIQTKDPDKLNKAKSVITQDFEEMLSVASTAKTIDSPNKEDIGNLSVAFRLSKQTMEDHEHPIHFGTEVIGHLRAKGIDCHRAGDVTEEYDEDRNFRDAIVLD